MRKTLIYYYNDNLVNRSQFFKALRMCCADINGQLDQDRYRYHVKLLQQHRCLPVCVQNIKDRKLYKFFVCVGE